MQYMFLVYADEGSWDALSPEEQQAGLAEYEAYAGRLAESGKLIGGDELAPVATATTVRNDGGRIITTDGPYAETKEQLGGYFLVEAGDLDEAIALAAECPGARHGVIEVRPVQSSS